MCEPHRGYHKRKSGVPKIENKQKPSLRGLFRRRKQTMTKNNNFRIEYLFINFHDNDFFMEMCNSAELIIDSFNKEHKGWESNLYIVTLPKAKQVFVKLAGQKHYGMLKLLVATKKIMSRGRV